VQGLKERTNERECEIGEKRQDRSCRDVKEGIESLDRASDNYEHLHCGEREIWSARSKYCEDKTEGTKSYTLADP